MRYFVGFLPRGEIAEYYGKITTEISDKFGVLDLSEFIPPHVTVKPPFEAESSEAVEAELADIAARHKAARMKVSGFGRLPETEKTIFLALDHDPSLLNIMQNTKDRLTSFEERDTYHKPDEITPHISIARHLSPMVADEIWQYLQGKPEPQFDTWFDNLTLFVREGTVWHAAKVFELGK